MQKSDRVNLESPWQPKTSKRMNRRLTLLQPEETLAIIPNAPANCLKHSVPIQIATVPSIHITFTNSDLPTGTQNRFRDILTPMFRDYVGTLVNPWEATTSDANVHKLQTIWNIVFPHMPHTVAIHDDAVFYLVRI